MKNGRHGSIAAWSTPAVRQRSVRPSGAARAPGTMSRPSRLAVAPRSPGRTAQPIGPGGAAATQLPKPLVAASAGSTTATSSR